MMAHRKLVKVGHIMSSYFPVGASLNDSMVDAWRTQNVQTFTGQSLALQVGFGLFEEQDGKTLDLDEMWPTTLIACGLWTNIKESLLPHVMINPEVIDDLERTLKTDESFRKNMAAASATGNSQKVSQGIAKRNPSRKSCCQSVHSGNSTRPVWRSCSVRRYR